MQILVTPSDIIKRCLWLEYKRFCIKDKKEDETKSKDKREEELKTMVSEDKPIMLSENDAFVIGLLKIVETPNLVHRFKAHIEEFLKIRSTIVNNRLFIRSNDILKEISSFKDCFPDYFNPSFEYKQGIDELKTFINKIYPEIEKLEITNIPNKEGKIIDHYSSNSVKNSLNPEKDKSVE